MGRRPIEVDFTALEGMCRIMCTLSEVAGVLNVSADTIERRCKEHYEETFAEVYKKHSAQGLMSLRRSQLRMAETNATMAIWCGKQYLNQRDSVTFRVEDIDAEIERRLAGMATAAAEESVH